MPWINVNVSKTLSESAQNEIKAEMANVLFETLQKEEKGLIVTFTQVVGYYRAGQRCEDAAVIDIKYIGMFPLSKKQEITRRLSAFYAKTLHLDPQKVTVLFTEKMSQDWGRGGGSYE